MNIEVFMLDSRKRVKLEVRRGDRIADVIHRLGLNPEEYVVLKGGKLVLEDDPVEEGDELTLVPVVSGG